MFCFIFFIIFEFDFVVKVNGYSSPHVDDYLVQEVQYDMDKYMEYNIPQLKSKRTTKKATTRTSTTIHVTVTKTSPETTSTTSATPQTTSTISATPQTSKQSTFVPIDYLVTITPDVINSFMKNLRLFNKTIEDQTLFMYGEPRPDKFEEVASLIVKYFTSIVERADRPPPPGATTDPYTGSSILTLTPHEDYIQENTREYKKTSTLPQSRSTNIQYVNHETEERINVFTTLKPVTEATLTSQHQPPIRSGLNQLPGRQESDHQAGPQTDHYQPPIRSGLNQLPGRQGTDHHLPSQVDHHQPPNRSGLNQLPGRQGPDHQAPHEASPPTQYPSIKSPDQGGTQDLPSTSPNQGAQYVVTPDQQVKLPDHQATQLTTTNQIETTAMRQGTDYPVDPAYYDMDALTGPPAVVTPRDNLLIAVTTPPPTTTEHPIVRDVKAKMVGNKHGYGTAFTRELCILLAEKEPRHAKEFFEAMEGVMMNVIHQGRLLSLGIRFETAIKFLLRTLNTFSPDVVQSFASYAIDALSEVHLLAPDVQALIRNVDIMFTAQEGEELLNTLVKVQEFPKNDTVFVVAQDVVDKFLKPFYRTEGTQTRANLISSVNTVMENRNLGYRRHIKVGKSIKKKDNGGFERDTRSKDGRNGKPMFFTDDKERNEVVLKELIENVKVMEAIKKYETKIVRTTAKYWPGYNIHEIEWNYGRRAHFDETKPKNKEESNNLNWKSINLKFNNKKDKMAAKHSGVPKYKIKTKQNAKVENIIKTRKNNGHLGIEIETDELHGITPKSESKPKKHRNKMDKHTRRKIRKHLKHKHPKLYVRLKKRHERRNKRKRINVKNKTLRKNTGPNRLKVIRELQNDKHERPPNAAKRDPYKNRLPSNKRRRPFSNSSKSRPHVKNRRPPGVNKRPSRAKRRPPCANNQPLNAKQPLGVNRQPLGAKRQPLGDNRPSGANKPPDANKRPPSILIRPPDTNQLPSMYLTPRYEYHSRRLKENLHLPRRSNAKPISKELSYSYEENDVKFHIQDAIRHPIDLKSKIQQNSLMFDTVQNVRRQMAPVDRINLKVESNYSDDEGTIKNNIYKVFNKNNY